ncbi:MAG: hypothetical protein EHM18_03990, partial [Acidobacteria bacterium]
MADLNVSTEFSQARALSEHAESARPRFRSFAWRVISLHMITYFVFGVLAYLILDYREVFETTE